MIPKFNDKDDKDFEEIKKNILQYLEKGKQ